jgi:hypothetical protein
MQSAARPGSARDGFAPVVGLKDLSVMAVSGVPVLAGLYFLAGIAIGVRFTAVAMVAAVPAAIAGAIALKQIHAIELTWWSAAILVAVLEAGFLFGAFWPPSRGA